MLDNPDQQLMMKELQEQIDIILDSIPERSREIFLMSRNDGFKNREIAEQLNISIKVVERHIGRALKALREVASPIPHQKGRANQ